MFDAWGVGAETTLPRSIDCWNYNAQWGYYYDRETSLYYCQNRMYDASTGRWINRDPIGYAGGINLYGYCGGGPVGASDPSGLSKGKIGFKIILDGNRYIQYWIHPTKRAAKKAAQRGSPTGQVVLHPRGHRGGPGHYHSDPDTGVHHSWEAEADNAKAREWKDYWKGGLLYDPCSQLSQDAKGDQGGFSWIELGEGVLEFGAPRVLGALGLAKDIGKDVLPAIVDPFVQEAKRKREEKLYEWLDE